MFILLPEYVSIIIDILERSGFEAYVVGGSVRDMVVGKAPDDYDVTTNAHPFEVAALFKEKYRVVETGLKHGTVTVINDGKAVEITTYRIDGDYIDNRKPESVTFTNSLDNDLSRRDFTINALAYNNSSGIIDLFGGICDIENKTLRCIGNAKERFCEDALRILRALRFSSRLDFEIEKLTSDAVISERELLNNISKERIFSELVKIFDTDFNERLSSVLIKYKAVFLVVFTEIESISDYELLCKKVSLISDSNLRLLYYISFLGESDVLLKRLKASNAVIKRAKNLLSACTNGKNVKTLTDARLFIKKYGFETSFDSASVLYDLNENVRLIDFISEVKNGNLCVTQKQLAVKGDEIASYVSGEKIGEMLDILLEKVIKGEIENKKDDLIYYVISNN